MALDTLDEFRWRGLVFDMTEGLGDALARGPLTVYNGFDPTAASLHVGSLMPLMCLARLQRAGHTPIAVVGGGTGLIGDPSGKTAERQLLDRERVATNVAGIRAQVERFIDFHAKKNPGRIVDNGDWLCSATMIGFLRDVGKHFTVNFMLAKESVKRRVESETGISYTEFSYMLLQAYDYLVLFDRAKCTLQTGGSDQWGNITAGIDLIRKVRGERAHGLVFPLVTNAAGAKFGKTEAGTVWLDPNLTSPFKFYQFWLNTEDSDVGKYLRYFTWLSREEIEGIEEQHAAQPEKREAQRVLAREMTTMLHGPTECEKAVRASSVLFGGDLEGIPASQLIEIFDGVPTTTLPRHELAVGVGLVDLAARSGLAPSKGEARRLIQAGGVYLNNRRVNDIAAKVDAAAAIDGRVIVLRKGARQQHLVLIEG